MTFENKQLFDAVAQINREWDLEIDLNDTLEIYGEHVLESIEDNVEAFREKIAWLLEQGLSDTVSDICNRYGILFTYDNGEFFSKFQKLLEQLGDSFAEEISMDMSLLEDLL